MRLRKINILSYIQSAQRYISTATARATATATPTATWSWAAATWAEFAAIKVVRAHVVTIAAAAN